MSQKPSKFAVLKEVVVEIFKELFANIVLLLIPFFGMLLFSFIASDKYLSKHSSEEIDLIGFLIGLFILYVVSCIIILASKIRNKINLKNYFKIFN